jgi:hypothetical protein
MAAVDRNKIELATRGSRIEIVSIPWRFHASKYELVGELFSPLLSAAQQASDLAGARVRGETSALQAAAFMAGELMRDVTFVPERSSSGDASVIFQLDFVADEFRAETSVFSAHSSEESLFRVKIKGRIRGDKFNVVDPTTDRTLFSFTRFEADKTLFFTREFPFLAHEARKDPTLFGEGENPRAFETVDLVLGVPVSGTFVKVRVEKVAGSLSAEVKNPVTNATVMSLPLASLNNISKLLKTVGQYLAVNPSVKESLETPPPPVELDANSSVA